MTRLIFLLAGALQLAWKRPDAGQQGSISQSANQIKSGEMVMYSTTECAYCSETKSWLTQNGFAFTRCNMSLDQHCQQEFNTPGGTPCLIGRGHSIKKDLIQMRFCRLQMRDETISQPDQPVWCFPAAVKKPLLHPVVIH